MEDLGTEKVLMDERMGHIDGSVSARYAHVTPDMRKRLMLGLTEQWETALDPRRAMYPTSLVRVLNELLQSRRLALHGVAWTRLGLCCWTRVSPAAEARTTTLPYFRVLTPRSKDPAAMRAIPTSSWPVRERTTPAVQQAADSPTVAQARAFCERGCSAGVSSGVCGSVGGVPCGCGSSGRSFVVGMANLRFSGVRQHVMNG